MALSMGTDWEEIAEKLVDKFQVAFSHIELDKVLFLSENEKTPKKYADVRNVGYPWNFITEYKYIMVFYENNTQPMTDSQRHMLVYHELLHIDESFEKVKKHDIEDFRVLVGRFGVNWDIDPNLQDILDDEIDGEI
ncbi:hypothetical protein D3C81_760850 [compost metagenome]